MSPIAFMCAFSSAPPPFRLSSRRERRIATEPASRRSNAARVRMTMEASVAPAGLSGSDLDGWYMRRCVSLARRANGQTRPNPVVGCVLLDANGAVVGEGWHERAGRAHAEAAALSDAKSRGVQVAGGTAYVSLEPCAHHGRTPPCADALVAAGLARVVVGIADPFEAVAGRGLARMRDAGIRVEVGVEKEICADVNEGFLRRVSQGLPFGTLKFAMTLDGKIATDQGSSRWITGVKARERVHAMRAGTDAIVVGGATVRRDDPRLSVRDGGEVEGRLAPFRVVMTRNLDIPVDARLWNGADAGELAGECVVLVDKKHGKPGVVAELVARGVCVEQVAGLRPRDAMSFLHGKDCLNVMWECGGTLAREAIADGCVQKVCAFVAAKIVGGVGSPSPVDGVSLCTDMAHAVQLQRRSVEVIDDSDVLITGYIE